MNVRKRLSVTVRKLIINSAIIVSKLFHLLIIIRNKVISNVFNSSAKKSFNGIFIIFQNRFLKREHFTQQYTINYILLRFFFLSLIIVYNYYTISYRFSIIEQENIYRCNIIQAAYARLNNLILIIRVNIIQNVLRTACHGILIIITTHASECIKFYLLSSINFGMCISTRVSNLSILKENTPRVNRKKIYTIYYY